MADEGKIKATMTRQQWREVYLRAQVVPPSTRETDRWMADLCAETCDVAEVTVNPATVQIQMKEFEAPKKASDPVTLLLSINAVRGLKWSATRTITGYKVGNEVLPPLNRLSRTGILDSLKAVGPDEKILKQVVKEAQLPASDTVDEGDELAEMVEKTEQNKTEPKP